MKIGILGSGTMGSALAARLRRAGHEVLVARRGAYADAVTFGDVAFLAVVWPHGLDAVSLDFGRKILVDVTNPESEDGQSLVLGFDTSGAEAIARVSRARVVKAFNHVYAELLLSDASPSVPYCGDDGDAKRTVHELIASMGFDPVDAGPLRVARYLEPLAMLTVQLVRGQGWGPTGIMWKLERLSLERSERGG